jgi:hypothetical protein
MNRRAQLRELTESLSRLVEILRLDKACHWRTHFEMSLSHAQSLLAREFEQSDLNALASSIMQVYGGMGSFNDYAPSIYDAHARRYRPIPGADDFEDVSGRVYEAALALRVVGRAA